MMEEEEEVLFDQAGLLTNRVKPVPSVKVHITSSKLFKTFSLCAAFFGLGLCIAIPGPTLLDLQARTGTDTETISRIFTGRSVGYLLGSILGGLLFDRFNQECLLSFALLLTAVGTALAPWSRNITLLLVLFAFQGISMGMLDTGGNVMCLDIWGRNSAPYMQTLHFAFGLGAFVAPLIAEPFLAPQNLSDINITDTPSFPDFTRPPNLGNNGNHRRDVDEVESAGRVGMQALLAPSSVNKPLRLSRDIHSNKPWETHDLVMRDNSLAENDRSKRETSEKEEISEKNLAAPPTVERVTNTTVSEAPPAAPKPKKPITSGKSLSQDKNVADGSKNDKELHKIDQKEKPQPVEKIKDISAVKSSIAPKTLVNCEINDTSAECKEDFTKEADSTDIVEGTSPLPTTTTKTTTTTTTTTTMAPTTTTTTKATTTTSLPPKSENIGGKNRNDTGNIDIENSAKPVSTTELPTNVTSSSIKNTVHKLINNVSEVINNLTKVQFAYITIAIFLYLMSVMFMCLCCFGSRSLRASRSSEIQGEYIIHKESKGFRIQILILLFLFYFLYVGMEVTYGGLIMTFAVTYLDWSKPKATFLTSVFWGSFAAGRGLAIFLSRCLSPVIMLISDLVLTCISLAGLVLVMETNHNMLWFCTITIGIGMSSIFPTGITWAERYMHLTGKATAVFVVGSALGEMAIPAITGFLFQNKSPMWLIYILLGSGLLSAILYIIMQNLASNKGERYERLNSLLTLASDDTEEMELEMDSVSVASSTSNHNHNHNHNENMTSAGTNGTNRKKVTFKLPGESPSSSPRNNVGRKIGSIFTGSNAKQD